MQLLTLGESFVLFSLVDEMHKSWDVDQTISDHSIARMADGTVTIKKTGIYLVYAQIVFYNSIVYNGECHGQVI